MLLGVSSGIREGNESRYESSTVGIWVVATFYIEYDGGYMNYA